MTAIGDTLTRKRGGTGPKTVRLLGSADGAWIVTDAEQHEPPFTLTASELAATYGVTPDLPESERSMLRRADTQRTAEATAAYRRADGRPPADVDGIRELVARQGRPRETPEEALAAAAAQEEVE